MEKWLCLCLICRRRAGTFLNHTYIPYYKLRGELRGSEDTDYTILLHRIRYIYDRLQRVRTLPQAHK
jgi:hypothetical protein